MHKWNSRSICIRCYFAISAFDGVSVLLYLHSRNAHVAFLLFRRVTVSLRLHSVSFCSFLWRLCCKAVGIHAWLPQAPPFFYSRMEPPILWTCLCCLRLSSALHAFVRFSWICRPFFACPSSVHYLYAVRSTFVLRWCLHWTKIWKRNF